MLAQNTIRTNQILAHNTNRTDQILAPTNRTKHNFAHNADRIKTAQNINRTKTLAKNTNRY